MPHDGRWIGDLERPEPPHEGRWIARPRRARWLPGAFGLTFLLSQMPNWITMFSGGRHRSTLLYLYLFLAALLVLTFGVTAYAAIRRRLSRRIGPKDAALLDGAFGDQFAAEVTIVAGKKGLGTDRGVVWFADGLVGFSGASASFVLAAWDVQVNWKEKSANAKRGTVPSGSLMLVDAPVAAYVVVSPLGDGTKAFRERLHAFEKETAAPDAERHWPPLAPYDEARALPAGVVRGGR